MAARLCLKDETGGRRFWPVKVGTIDTEAIIQDRDQLFAEACRLYQNGIKWWPDDRFERELIAPQQKARLETDPWEEAVLDYVKGRQSVLPGEIARHALFIENKGVDRRASNRIAAILTAAGWARSLKMRHGYYPYLPPG